MLNEQANVRRIPSFDGAEIAVHEMGVADGRPVLLLHGLFSSAYVNWIKYGHAALLAGAGLRVIMPDLRAHGDSDKPHDPLAYPADVLVQDTLHLVAALGLEDYDLGGFSLGARTAVRSVLAGLSPRRLILGGMGMEGLAGWSDRSAHFIDAIDRFGSIERGEKAFMAQAFMKTMKVDRVAARLLLTSVDDTPADAIAGLKMPVMLLCGTQDRDNGDPEKLAAALPNATMRWCPGTHMSCITEADFGAALADFLA